MTKKTGRNEPCPCGSGKKYKHCCGNNIIPFPAVKNSDDFFKKYEDLIENRDYSQGAPPTMMESLGSPNLATDALNELKRKSGNKEFQSIEELREFINIEMEEENEKGLDDFLGLSPSDIYKVLHGTMEDCRHIMEINSGPFSTSLENVPALKQCRWLLEYIGENKKGLRATQKGNLPRTLVREFYELFIRDTDKYPRTPANESGVPKIQEARFFLRDEGYIKFKHGYFSLTKKGRTVIDDFNPVSFYLDLLEYFMEKFNWLYGTGFPGSLKMLQNARVFCLYILKEKARDSVNGEELGLLFLKAFPALKENKENLRYENAVHGFDYLFMENIAEYLGLLVREVRGESIFEITNWYRATELFYELFLWKK